MDSVYLSPISKKNYDSKLLSMGLGLKPGEAFDNIWSKEIKKIENQLSKSACGGFSLSTYLENQLYMKFGIKIQISPWVYYLIRKQNHHKGKGVYSVQMLEVAKEIGIIPLSAFNIPMEVTEYNGEVTQSVLDKKLKGFKIIFSRVDVDDPKEIKRVIKTTGGILLAYDLKQSFYTGRVNGRVPMPQPGEAHKGGHLTCGEDWDTFDDLTVINSWGEEWDEDGKFKTPFAHKPREAWCVYITKKDIEYKIVSDGMYGDTNFHKQYMDTLSPKINATVEKINDYYVLVAGTFKTKEEAKIALNELDAIKAKLPLNDYKRLWIDTYFIQEFETDTEEEPTEPEKPEPTEPESVEIKEYTLIIKEDNDNYVKYVAKISKEIGINLTRKEYKYEHKNNKENVWLLATSDVKENLEIIREKLRKTKLNRITTLSRGKYLIKEV